MRALGGRGKVGLRRMPERIAWILLKDWILC